MWHYARGVAQTRLGRLMQAQLSLIELRKIADGPDARSLIVAGGTAPASDLLHIGGDHLDAEIAAVQDDGTHAVILLESAVARQDAMVYMEPPPFYFPVRQALGAVLLDQGRAKKAEGVYRKDLEQYPKNGWSLYGLARSLEAQGKRREAQWAQQGHENAFARADVALGASRF
jgi:tetratricopeptide (TPR) repeat protein